MAKRPIKSPEEQAYTLDEAIRASVAHLDALYTKRAHRRGTGYIAGWKYCGCGRTHIGPIAPSDGNATQEERDRRHCRECKGRQDEALYVREYGARP